ncbi:MAG: hypothetical protein CUN54_08440 [Phototrophicales bacterium]|nr:MAG: hypothetical protein CUN54_08440 [Phototrophicales bacterium]
MTQEKRRKWQINTRETVVLKPHIKNDSADNALRFIFVDERWLYQHTDMNWAGRKIESPAKRFLQQAVTFCSSS